jgi:formylglycine-generating enzyme required for sulfatase activity
VKTISYFVLGLATLCAFACQSSAVRTSSNKTQDLQATKSMSVGAPFPNAKAVWLPKGSFWMGSPSLEPGHSNDEKRHKVTLQKGFWMWTTEVTQGQYKTLTGLSPSHFKKCGSSCPVERVSWSDAAKFANALSRKQGLSECFASDGKQLKAKYRGSKLYDACNGWRLPTEAEWEYAARAGTTTPYHTGRCLHHSQASFNGTSQLPGCSAGPQQKSPAPVKSFAANQWGLFDMHGNVAEWTLDRWLSDLTKLGSISPLGLSVDKRRVCRGGGWVNGAKYNRSAIRNSYWLGYKIYSLGFRLVRSPR